METRNLGGLGADVSLLGFGCMRFPTGAEGKIDVAASRALLERAHAAGVNYYDTAYFYHDGESEPFVGQVLDNWPRESYFLVSKLPTILIHSLDEAKRIFSVQWERLGKDYLDCYLLHNLNGARFREMVALGVVDWCLEMQRQGKFKKFGFSFHGSFADFSEIITARHWDLCQLQLNYMDVEEQAGLAGYQLAESLGVPVVIMEPVKGGALASPPTEVAELFRAAGADRSAASWALRWAGSLPGVMTVLSGMSTAEQVADNLATFGDFHPLNAGEQAMITQAAALFHKRVRNGCTACRYCMPCPVGVDIPENFRLWNRYGVYAQRRDAARRWKELGDGAKAKNCISCGKCEEACPQNLNIRANLAQAQAEMDLL